MSVCPLTGLSLIIWSMPCLLDLSTVKVLSPHHKQKVGHGVILCDQLMSFSSTICHLLLLVSTDDSCLNQVLY